MVLFLKFNIAVGHYFCREPTVLVQWVVYSFPYYHLNVLMLMHRRFFLSVSTKLKQ